MYVYIQIDDVNTIIRSSNLQQDMKTNKIVILNMYMYSISNVKKKKTNAFCSYVLC